MVSPLPIGAYPEERRLATVLFADVQGFTALAEKLDYEMVGDLLKEVWLRLDAVIEANGGYIDKHIGDAVMAVWGAPFGGENDAERAIVAGLQLQTSLEEYTRQTRVPGAEALQIRIGINTGQVLAGYVGVNNEYTVLGDTVNVANRLEQSAEPGAVVISESTYRMVRGKFKFRRLPEIQLKGKTEPIAPLLVDGVMEIPGRMRYNSVGGVETRMVGRDKELAELLDLYHQTPDTETATLVLITGDAGLGKSRLLMEFTSHLEMQETGFGLMAARGLAQTSEVPFYLWKTLWQSVFELWDFDSPAAREKFLDGIQKVWCSESEPFAAVEATHLIGSLIGLKWPESIILDAYENSPELRKKRAFELTRQLLHCFCARNPLVLQFDDLQWADSGSLELIAYLLKPTTISLPLLILSAARPEFLRQQPRWANLSKSITLQPLPANAETVAQAYPQLRSLPTSLLQELAQRADGNPYFLEEMVKSLIKNGIPKKESGSAILEKLHDQPPESLMAMLQARLDDLSREARSVAVLASVVGRVFWVGAVKAAVRPAISLGTGPLGTLPDSVLDRVIQDALRQLVQSELAFPRAGTKYSDEQEFIFKHSLLRDVAYSLIPHRFRQHYHLAVAQWLAERPHPDFQYMAAGHFEQAGAHFEAAAQLENVASATRARGFTTEADKMLSRAQRLRQEVEQT